MQVRLMLLLSISGGPTVLSNSSTASAEHLHNTRLRGPNISRWRRRYRIFDTKKKYAYRLVFDHHGKNIFDDKHSKNPKFTWTVSKHVRGWFWERTSWAMLSCVCTKCGAPGQLLGRYGQHHGWHLSHSQVPRWELRFSNNRGQYKPINIYHCCTYLGKVMNVPCFLMGSFPYDGIASMESMAPGWRSWSWDDSHLLHQLLYRLINWSPISTMKIKTCRFDSI